MWILMSIKIVTDSTADLSSEEAQQYGIHIIPLKIDLNGKTYLDRVDITPSEFMREMRKSEELPKTSQPSFGTFTELYERLTADGSEVLSIHCAGPLSGTVQTAQSAADQFDGKVTVVDALYISRGLAFQVIEASNLAKLGKSIKEILHRIEEVRHHTRLFVVVDTLENLTKGGRIGKGRALIGSLLHIKPIAVLKDGMYSPMANVRNYSQVIKHLVKNFKEDVDGKTIKGIGLAHADGMELATRLKEKLHELYENLEIKIVETTPIISTHTGPGAIGFTYFAE